MIKFDFDTYVKPFIKKEEYEELYNKKEEILRKFQESEMTGWKNKIEEKVVNEIKATSEFIKKNYDCMVVIGIGGSFLGSYAFSNIFKSYFNDKKYEVIYAGTTLSSKYLDELLNYLKDKNFCITVISKSGTTMETTITYKLLKDLLKRKYRKEEIKDRIIVITDKEKGSLRQEANEMNYKSFIIPDDIGGRYSFLTPAHLLPLSLNYSLDEIIKGYERGKKYLEEAYKYAVTRKLLYNNHKYIENYCVYEENMYFFTEWLKQLFGETEGKNNVGIFPISTVNTRDLHSLGQFIQEGNKIIFETFIKIKKSNNYVNYNQEDLHNINNIVEESVMRAHFKGKVPCIEIEISDITCENISSLMYFFMLSAAFSGYLFNVEPFNQPGVEVYKREVRESLNNL